MNVVVCGQVKSENSSLPVTVPVSKTRVLKLPNIVSSVGTCFSGHCHSAEEEVVERLKQK